MNPKMTWMLLLPVGRGWKKVPVTGRMTLGSHEHCDVRLRLPGVTPRHMRLQVNGDRLEAVNLVDPDATRVGDQPLGPRPQLLESGDVLRLGTATLVVLAQRGDMLQLGEIQSASPLMLQVFVNLLLSAQTPWPVLLTASRGWARNWRRGSCTSARRGAKVRSWR